jgi:putative component of membrane protein insertase Oxa1/YidC/SpoIIIJ protein YidD
MLVFVGKSGLTFIQVAKITACHPSFSMGYNPNRQKLAMVVELNT